MDLPETLSVNTIEPELRSQTSQDGASNGTSNETTLTSSDSATGLEGYAHRTSFDIFIRPRHGKPTRDRGWYRNIFMKDSLRNDISHEYLAGLAEDIEADKVDTVVHQRMGATNPRLMGAYNWRYANCEHFVSAIIRRLGLDHRSTQIRGTAYIVSLLLWIIFWAAKIPIRWTLAKGILKFLPLAVLSQIERLPQFYAAMIAAAATLGCEAIFLVISLMIYSCQKRSLSKQEKCLKRRIILAHFVVGCVSSGYLFLFFYLFDSQFPLDSLEAIVGGISVGVVITIITEIVKSRLRVYLTKQVIWKLNNNNTTTCDVETDPLSPETVKGRYGSHQ